MGNIPDEMIRVNAILSEYIVIHDAVFKFSSRKAVPIPGLFKPIDYGRHFRDLNFLVFGLQEISLALAGKPGTPNIFLQYVISLREAIQSLQEICDRLYKKSQGANLAYPMTEYNSDVNEYQQHVNNYRKLGVELNQYLRN